MVTSGLGPLTGSKPRKKVDKMPRYVKEEALGLFLLQDGSEGCDAASEPLHSGTKEEP